MALLLACVCPTEAYAAFPGDNGKIAYVSGGQIHTMNPDGTSQTPVPGIRCCEDSPAWSPDGTQIAFIDDVDAWTMNADGSQRDIVERQHYESYDYNPAWSPDGTKILIETLIYAVDEEPPYYYTDIEVYDLNANTRASSPLPFESSRPAWSPDGSKIALDGIRTVNTNGTGMTLITNGSDWDPDWSPDGSKIAFYRYEGGCCATNASEIYVVNRDGTGLTRLTNNSVPDSLPVWSPDGTKIAFTSYQNGRSDIWVMDADGGNPTQLTRNGGYAPDWQPLLRGYVRPRGATPTRVSLVPAAKQCTSPNSTHGAPLSFPSCSPPQTETSATFLGVGDGHPVPARSIGSVVLRVIDGSATPGDDSDVQIRVSLTHVMRPDGSEYPGELRLELPLRITDRFNRPHPNVVGPGTVTDTSFYATVPCASTSDPLTGSTCALTSTADAILPATVREGARSVWGLGQVKVHDGGADEDGDTAADNQLLAVQGVFIP